MVLTPFRFRVRIQGVGAGARAHPWGGVSPFKMHYSIAFKHQFIIGRPPLGEILYPPLVLTTILPPTSKYNPPPLARLNSLTPRINLNLQRRNSELAKKFGARRPRWVPLRRLRGGGQSALSSLNVIGWRHIIVCGSLKLAFILVMLFCETHDLVSEIISVSAKREMRMKNCRYCEHY